MAASIGESSLICRDRSDRQKEPSLETRCDLTLSAPVEKKLQVFRRVAAVKVHKVKDGFLTPHSQLEEQLAIPPEATRIEVYLVESVGVLAGSG